MLTSVYVDGFNLYYGCLKGTPYKWLDLGALCQALLPPNKIQRIRYFTAKVNAHADPHQPVRQSAYLRALQTVPGLTVHLGHFLTSTARMPLAKPVPGGPRTVEVTKTEEKGSDVNLATYLPADAFRADAETFVVISNDSDLMEPIRLVSQELGYRVGIVNSHPNVSRALQRTRPSFTKQIRCGVLAVSQFPEKLSDAHGAITKPEAW
ncbi:MAG: NYN domain-containing protein [Pseudonocardiaceae bacterium]